MQEPAPKEKRASFKGKMIRSKTPTNPRREATKGFHSMQILIDAGVSISYEDYVAGGGRPNDLAWDISKGNAEVTGSW